jgi:hypothetical protein
MSDHTKNENKDHNVVLWVAIYVQFPDDGLFNPKHVACFENVKLYWTDNMLFWLLLRNNRMNDINLLKPSGNFTYHQV